MIKQKTTEDYAIDIIVHVILLVLTIFILYPLIYVVSNSISLPDAVARKEVVLWPVGFSTASYKLLFENKDLLISYKNAIVYTVLGTSYSMVLTIFAAYALSRKRLGGRNIIMLFISFTMLFGGGLIPTYMVVKDLKMTNSIWSMIIPCAISQWNLILMRTSFMQIPDSLEESARLDGANDFRIMWKIIVPMSIPVISTITLFYAVGKWNDYFTPLIYLNKKSLYPLQLIMRSLLVTMDDNTLNREMVSPDGLRTFTPMGFRCAIIIASMLPLLIAYPFIQRYFVKGVMVGAIKG